METPETSPAPYKQGLEQLLEKLPPETGEILMVGSIPHWLDAGSAALLFPKDAHVALETIEGFRFVSERAPGQLEYHPLARQCLLETLQYQDPELFRKMSGVLAQEYQRRLQAEPASTGINAMEWLYHSLASDPSAGIRQTANLFHELTESQEMGSAERLVRLTREQQDWVTELVPWLTYFDAFIKFARYEEIDSRGLDCLAAGFPDSRLAACLLRLLGRLAVRNQQWESGRKYLKKALEIGQKLGDLESQALVQMDLGDLFRNLVDSSGGIMVESREFVNGLHVLLYGLNRGPLLLYRFLSERIDAIPNLHGTNYQNWVAMRLIRLALNNYRSALHSFELLHNLHGKVEVSSRMASLSLSLGYTRTARQRCEESLKDPLVISSPYYVARALMVIGQAERSQNQLPQSIQHLSSALKTFEQYRDWESAARAGFELGESCEKAGDFVRAVGAYQHCLDAVSRSANILLQSEVFHHLKKIATTSAPGPIAGQAADEQCWKIKQVAYIDRFPGPVEQAFRKLTNWLAYPFVFLFVVALIVGAGIAMQFIEGELKLNLPGIQWLQALDLVAGLLLPLLMIWGYHLLYILLGQIITFSLSFTKVDESQPEMYVLDAQGITQKGRKGMDDLRLAWAELQTVVMDDRSLFRKPLTFSSRLVFRNQTGTLTLPASIFRFQELQNEVELKLAAGNKIPAKVQTRLSILRTPWLIIALAIGLAIAVAGVTGVFGIHPYGCYDPLVHNPTDVCRLEFRLYVQPFIQLGLLLSSLIFMLITFLRWQLANGLARKALADSLPRPTPGKNP
jgi:hypothetical protein